MKCDKGIVEAMASAGLVARVDETDDGCRIVTDFTLSDFDSLAIYLEEMGGAWRLTDRGHTVGWLLDHQVEMTEVRFDALGRTMLQCRTIYEDGCIVRGISKSPALDLVQMITAIIRVADLRYLDRRTVRSTFLDDVKGVFEERYPSCETGKILSTDRGERFRVDVYVDREKPLLVFGIRTKDRCKDASLAIMALSEDMEFESVAIVDEGADIPKRDLEFLRNRVGSVMTLDEARTTELRSEPTVVVGIGTSRNVSYTL